MIGLPATSPEMRAYAKAQFDLAERAFDIVTKNLLCSSGHYWVHRADLEDGLECGDRTREQHLPGGERMAFRPAIDDLRLDLTLPDVAGYNYIEDARRGLQKIMDNLTLLQRGDQVMVTVEVETGKLVMVVTSPERRRVIS
jgi:hypothetical protein